MLLEITENDFVDIMKKDCYWSLTDEATRCIYKHFKDDTMEDRNYFINAFFMATEVSIEDIFNENKDKFKNICDTDTYLEKNDEIIFDGATYEIYDRIIYEDGSIGYLLV